MILITSFSKYFIYFY